MAFDPLAQPIGRKRIAHPIYGWAEITGPDKSRQGRKKTDDSPCLPRLRTSQTGASLILSTTDGAGWPRIGFFTEGYEGNKELLAQAKLKSAEGTKYDSLGEASTASVGPGKQPINYSSKA